MNVHSLSSEKLEIRTSLEFQEVAMSGVLYALIKLQEYPHDIQAPLEKSD